MTYLYCNGEKLIPFEFSDYDSMHKDDNSLSDFPVPSGAIESD